MYLYVDVLQEIHAFYVKLSLFQFFLHCQQPLLSFCFLCYICYNHSQVWWKMLFNRLINYYVLEEIMCQNKYKKIKLKLKHKYARLPTLPTLCNYEKCSKVRINKVHCVAANSIPGSSPTNTCTCTRSKK